MLIFSPQHHRSGMQRVDPSPPHFLYGLFLAALTLSQEVSQILYCFSWWLIVRKR